MAEDRRRRPDYSGDGSNSPREGASDPLAELARLIGQSDPFAELGKRNPRNSGGQDDRPAPEWLARSTPSDRDEGGYTPRAPQSYVPSYRPLPYQPPAHEDAADYRPQTRADYYAEQDRYESDPAAQDDHRGEHDAYYEGGDQNPPDDRYRVALPSGQYDSDAYYAEDGHMPPQDDLGVIGPRRRGGLLTIMAVLGLAVIGVAGAFGYRAFTSGSSSAPASPPVIKADPTPPKTVPAPAPQASADAQAKPFQDRVAPPTERVVPREEQPVSLPITPPTPRVTAPQPSAQSMAPLVSPPAPTSVSEPKKVKTVTIRQESTSDAGGLVAAPAAPPPPARTPATKQPTAITPQADSARSKLAARTPPAASGAYVVQVSAQRTEAEAQSSYEALQSKYPSVLGSRSASIRRVDLGDKGGVFFRAQVGTFATSEQATTFCNSLKDVGGQCIVQKN